MDIKNKPEESAGALRRRFIEPPFSVLDTKTKSWQDGRKELLKIGLKSELGRDEGLTFGKGLGIELEDGTENRTSIFDPYLCKIIYKWFCPEGGTVLDPFAGGSVRGVIAHKMGLKYTGIELRKEQVDANIAQGKELCVGNEPTWIANDSNVELNNIDNDSFDFVLSCPPYADLEVYSDDPADISNMVYADFLQVYRSIISKTVDKLKKGQLAVFVVGDVRDKDGYYYNFIGDTKTAFIDAGAKLYNEAILLNSIASASLRVNGNMGSKKLCKVHQNILCFKKDGDMPTTLKKKIQVDYINKCNEEGCGGKLKRQADNRKICEDCMTEGV